MLARIRTMFAMGRDRGANAVEFGLLTAGLSVAVITAVFLLGDVVTQTFNDVASSISSAR